MDSSATKYDGKIPISLILCAEKVLGRVIMRMIYRRMLGFDDFPVTIESYLGFHGWDET